MAEQNYGEQLDRFVEAVIATPRVALPNTDAELASLARIAAGLRGLPREDFKERLKADLIRRASMATGTAVAAEKAASSEQVGTTTKQGSLPSGYPTITPYLIVNRASDFIEFLKTAFGGTERLRFPIKDRPDLLMHAEVAVGNSIIELADATEKFAAAPQTLHLYVPDAVDAVYARAIAAGATTVHPPQDQHWGDRMGTLRDAFGNVWYVATPKGWTPGPEGLRSIQPYLHVRGAAKMIAFLEEAFGADAQGVAKSPEGQVFHSTIQIGNWSLEVDDASEHAGEPMPCHLHLHVPDADALYARAMQAGATSIEAPSDKPYGRSGAVRDAFGNSWYITTSPAAASQQAAQPEAQAGAAAPSQDSSKDARTSQPQIAAGSVRASVSPRLTFKDAAKAIEFYERALGARETFRFEAGGRIAHAEIAIGDSTIDVAEEWPEGGRFSAETLGNSPVWMSLEVDDVDAFAERAVNAGMKVKRPIQDQFYGHRDVLLTDPFGYNWGVYTVKEEMSVEEMHRRMQGLTTGPEGGKLPDESRPAPRVSPVPRGFRTVQPYLVASDGPALLDFVRNVFDADETCRILGPRGVHGETRIGDTTIMLGGGVPGQGFTENLHQGALHVYVQDTDAVYAKALAAGATSVGAPQDHEYGERGAGVKDPAGNYWYIATHKGESYIPEGLHSVNVYMHPLRAEPLIRFMKAAFGAEEIARYASPDGVVHHAQVRITDSVIEMGEAHGPYQPMESMFYLYVPDADAVYQRALAAGAKTLHEPKDQPYGDRNAAVTDAFGNTWYIATHIRERQP